MQVAKASTNPSAKIKSSKKKKTVLQCDASMSGIGVCLLQEGHPVAYTSRALTPTETNYAQIEKELLSIVFGNDRLRAISIVERFLFTLTTNPWNPL